VNSAHRAASGGGDNKIGCAGSAVSLPINLSERQSLLTIRPPARPVEELEILSSAIGLTVSPTGRSIQPGMSPMFAGFLGQSEDKWNRRKQVNMGDVPGFSSQSAKGCRAGNIDSGACSKCRLKSVEESCQVSKKSFLGLQKAAHLDALIHQELWLFHYAGNGMGISWCCRWRLWGARYWWLTCRGEQCRPRRTAWRCPISGTRSRMGDHRPL
jgi:hypothetical protein